MSRIQMGFGLVVALVLLSSPICLAQENVFEGKFVSIQKKSNPANSVDLEKVELKTLGGRAFLVGIGTDTPDNWQKGKKVWVALDDVSEVTVFGTLEELRKAGNPQDAPKKDGGGR
jgi:hypothetical protein